LAEADPIPCADLLEILRPSLAPCVEIDGVCASVVRYEPSAGYVPRGWIGGAGTRETIQLILVTAEPGDPADGEQYPDGDSDATIRLYNGFSRGFVRNLNLHRGGRPAPFHVNLRRILDLFWPGVSIDDQLERTWITPAVLCSAPFSSGAIPRRVESACGSRYLRKQLEALPDAFVVSLGLKAKARLALIGRRPDAEAQHPSARANTNPGPTWSAAATLFHEFLRHAAS
jgi:hypothetical protein